MAERLAQQLNDFAAHVRSPHLHPPPDDVEDRRMAIYRDLYRRNLASFIEGSFPVLYRLLDEDKWRTLIRDFSDTHRCQTPLFPEIPREFLRYLQDERGEQPDDPPFLLELAHYEWVELALDLDPQDLEAIPAQADGDLVDGVPVLSPLAWPLAYRYPVHEIRPEFQPDSPPAEPTLLLVYRDRGDRVRFTRLNPLTAGLLAELQANPDHTGRQAITAVARANGHPDPDAMVEAGTRLLGGLRERDVILGARPDP
ncbi:DUF2063 domain-containing protein [Marinihelvus fidelis]|uniref:DUF2063 domain-containing protein n=1 Tax=Marinihelvus fidelis TaxID=2613842 RepID=A0A5N0TBW2_9GAMM|nr:putative DNA-binding domain-containing protein [Marinihelvus fidelis]KAA9132502.1 DUF2063 domain-containing protein [Marinihelvus fidelis]